MSTPEEASALRVSRLQQQQERVEAATVPIYVSSRPVEHVGSGVLLKLGEERFLLTAAHVADNRDRGDLYLGGEQTPVRITGTVTSSKTPDGNRDSDKVDAAVIHLSRETVAHMEDALFLTAGELDVAEPRHDDFFLVAGYPCSKQRLPRAGDTITAYLYPFVAVSKPETDYDQPLDPATHIKLGFSKGEMWRADVGRVTAPDPYGLSGCGIWWLNGYAEAHPNPPQLAGIITEWRPRAGHLLGSRVNVLLSAVFRVHPHLRDLLP